MFESSINHRRAIFNLVTESGNLVGYRVVVKKSVGVYHSGEHIEYVFDVEKEVVDNLGITVPNVAGSITMYARNIAGMSTLVSNEEDDRKYPVPVQDVSNKPDIIVKFFGKVTAESSETFNEEAMSLKEILRVLPKELKGAAQSYKDGVQEVNDFVHLILTDKETQDQLRESFDEVAKEHPVLARFVSFDNFMNKLAKHAKKSKKKH